MGELQPHEEQNEPISHEEEETLPHDDTIEEYGEHEQYEDEDEYEYDPSPIVRIELDDGKEFECTPDNTTIIVHKADPEYDFLVIKGEEDEYEEDDENIQTIASGYFYFRDRINDFDDKIYEMVDKEFPIHAIDEVHDVIKAAYQIFKGQKMRRQALEAASNREMNDSEKRHVDFLGYLLEHDMLKPEDFGDDIKSTI